MRIIQTLVLSGSVNIKIEGNKIVSLGGPIEVTYSDKVLEISSTLKISEKTHISGNVVSLGTINGSLTIGDDILIDGIPLDKIVSSNNIPSVTEFDFSGTFSDPSSGYMLGLSVIYLSGSSKCEFNENDGKGINGISLIKLADASSFVINEEFGSDNLNIVISGTSTCLIKEMDIMYLNIIASGSSKLIMNGFAESLNMVSSGVSEIDCRFVECQRITSLERSNSVIRL